MLGRTGRLSGVSGERLHQGESSTEPGRAEIAIGRDRRDIGDEGEIQASVIDRVAGRAIRGVASCHDGDGVSLCCRSIGGADARIRCGPLNMSRRDRPVTRITGRFAPA